MKMRTLKSQARNRPTGSSSTNLFINNGNLQQGKAPIWHFANATEEFFLKKSFSRGGSPAIIFQNQPYRTRGLPVTLRITSRNPLRAYTIKISSHQNNITLTVSFKSSVFTSISRHSPLVLRLNYIEDITPYNHLSYIWSRCHLRCPRYGHAW